MSPLPSEAAWKILREAGGDRANEAKALYRRATMTDAKELRQRLFPSSSGTALDESNVRKGFNAILDKAGVHGRGPHQMRRSFASLLLQAGAPITYVSRQLGHRDSAITLTVYAHWLPDSTTQKAVDRLDDFTPAVAHPLHRAAEPALRKTA